MSLLPDWGASDDWGWLVPTPNVITEKDIEQFIKRVIAAFEEQRVKSQFATLILCSKEDYQSSFKSVRFSSNDLDKPILDYRKELMPQQYDMYKYLCARPSGKVHAESILLKQLDNLLSGYQSKKYELPSCIVLYSWITPCSDCTELIIDKLCTPPYDDIPTVVAYTTNTHAKGDNVEKARQRLRDSGFTVQQVPYPKLPIWNKPIVSF